MKRKEQRSGEDCEVLRLIFKICSLIQGWLRIFCIPCFQERETREAALFLHPHPSPGHGGARAEDLFGFCPLFLGVYGGFSMARMPGPGLWSGRQDSDWEGMNALFVKIREHWKLIVKGVRISCCDSPPCGTMAGPRHDSTGEGMDVLKGL